MSTIHTVFTAGYRLIAALLLCSILISGCTKATTGSDAFPAAGEIRVISATPISDSESRARNLILNGYFDEWWAGAPAPSGFVAPMPAFSTLRKVTENGKIICVQEWTKSDNTATSSNLFRVLVGETKPDAQYELTINGYSMEGGSIFVSIYENPEGGAPVALANEAITIKPTDTTPTAYKASFKTKNGGNVSMIARSRNPDGATGKIAWISWSLMLGGSLGEVEKPKDAA